MSLADDGVGVQRLREIAPRLGRLLAAKSLLSDGSAVPSV